MKIQNGGNTESTAENYEIFIEYDWFSTSKGFIWHITQVLMLNGYWVIHISLLLKSSLWHPVTLYSNSMGCILTSFNAAES